MATTTTIHFSPIALTYAQSLLDLAGDRSAEVGQELASLREVFEQTPNFALYLADPAIGDVERGEALERIFKGKVSTLVYNFLRVLSNHGRAGSLPEVIGAYDELLEEKLGKVEVDVTVARPLTPDQLADVQQKISRAIGKDAVVHTYVDDSIIGGMIVRVKDELIDASVRYQLQAMKKQLLAKIPK